MIYLVRHGQTEFNLARRAQGALDSNLTALGVSQAARMGDLLKTLVSDPEHCHIVCSPQGRAQHTARLIQTAMANYRPITTDSRLREIAMGAWDGRSYVEIEAGWPGTMAKGPGWFFDSPDGDRYEDLTARLGDWLEEARAEGGELIAVSHGVAGRVLRGLVLGLRPEEAFHLAVPQDAVFRLWGDQVDRIDCEPVG